MLKPRLSNRYAKSVLDLAQERGEMDRIYEDMMYLQQLTKGSRDFLNLLRSPVVPADKKEAVIQAIAGPNISQTTMAFARLLVAKGREGDLPEIAGAYIRQYKERKGIHVVKLTTAQPVSDGLKQRIVEQVKKSGDMQKIELETTVDPRIIGGFVLQAGDKLVDASISYDLKQVSTQFENNDFIYKVR